MTSVVKPSDICSYEDSPWRTEFWLGREYEDRAERIALAHLLPPRGTRLCEIGAGFGRLADFYRGYEHVILLDYSRSMLREARERLSDARFVFVAADLYNLPLADSALDTAVTVRVLHHVADIPRAFAEIERVVRPQGAYVLEYANKRHLKAILRYWLRSFAKIADPPADRQSRDPQRDPAGSLAGRSATPSGDKPSTERSERVHSPSPFTLEPLEFARLNFDFHPRYIEANLREVNLIAQKQRAVSMFRISMLKRVVPANLLASFDGILQSPISNLQLSPSIFLRTRSAKPGAPVLNDALWRCVVCGSTDIAETRQALQCRACGHLYPLVDGIIDFKGGREG